MAKVKDATAREARTWLIEHNFEGVKQGQGRLSREAVAHFEKETNSRVVTRLKPSNTVTVAISKVDAKGKTRTRKVEKPISEVREIAQTLGLAGARGILSASTLKAVSEHLSK